MKVEKKETIVCPNCGDERTGTFCQTCGQNDRNYRRGFSPIFRELLKETFDYESRLWHTLSTLIFKPGQLSREFSLDRRATYISPIRLYIVISLIVFFVVTINSPFAEVEPDVDYAEIASQTMALKNEVDLTPVLSLLDSDNQKKVHAIDERPDRSPAKLALYQISKGISSGSDPLSSHRTAYVINVLYDPHQVADLYVESLPLAAFAVLPCFTLILLLFYRGKRLFPIDHLVFVIHLQSLILILLTVSVLLPGEADPSGAGIYFGGDVDLILQFGTPNMVLIALLVIYSFMAFKVNYRDSYPITLLKFPFLMLAYLVISGVMVLFLAYAISVRY